MPKTSYNAKDYPASLTYDSETVALASLLCAAYAEGNAIMMTGGR